MLKTDLSDELINLSMENLHLEKELAALSHDISSFTKKYLSELRVPFEEMKTLQMQIEAYRSRTGFSKPLKDEELPRPKEFSVQEKAKKLYRRLLKLAHPDVSIGHSHFIPEITEAYERHDFRKLLEIENRLAMRSATDLRWEYNELIDDNFDLRCRLDNLRESEINRLREIMPQADKKIMMARISEYLSVQIKGLREELVTERSKYIEQLKVV